MGFLSKINRARKKATSAITKPFVKAASKISDKFIPNELRFLAPYAAGIGTLMLPGSMGPMMRAFSAAGLNSLGQIAADETPVEDISDLNALSIALAGGVGALGSNSVSDSMRSGIVDPKDAIRSQMAEAPIGLSQVPSDFVQPDVGFLQGVENVGREGIASLSDYVTGGRETLAGLGSNPEKLMSLGGVKDAASALAPALSQGSGDVAYEAAVDLKNEQDRLDAEEAAQIEETTTANESERADLQMTFMRQADIGEDKIKETLEMNDLGEYYTPPVESAANGGIMGRTGFKNGGNDNMFSNLLNKISPLFVDEDGDFRSGLQKAKFALADVMGGKGYDFVTGAEWYNKLDEDTQREILLMKQKIRDNPEAYSFSPRMKQLTEQPVYDEEFAGKFGYGSRYAEGGIIGLKEGGMLNFGGREMDLRGGGFVPIGKKERADDVPARLSKNEFVMTADAVRAAGGGSVNKGAQRMYDVMNKLEARA